MLLLDIVKRSSRSLLSAKTRTLLTAFAIAVGSFALTLTLGASNGAHNYADVIIKDNFDPSELIVTNDATLFSATDSSKPQVYDPNLGNVTSAAGATRQVKMLTDSDITRLKQVDGVSAVRPAISLGLQYLTRDGQKKYAATAQAYDDYKNPSLLAGSIPATLASRTIILPEGFVAPLGFSSASNAVGKQVRLSVQKQIDQTAALSSLLQGDTSALQSLGAQSTSMEEKFTVVAVTKTPSTLVQPGSALFLNIGSDDVSRLNDYATNGSANYHKYLTAYVKVTDGTDTSKLNATQAAVKKLGYGAQSILDTQKTITQVIT